MRIVLVYITVGLLAFAGFVLADAPAAYVWSQVPVATKRRLPVEVSGVAGTLWDGRARLGYRERQARLDWQLRPWALLFAEAVLDFDARTQGVKLTGQARADWSRTYRFVGVNGRVTSDFVNQFLERRSASLEGNFTLDNVKAAWQREQGFQKASGRIRWPGGLVIYENRGRAFNKDMPALVGEIGSREGDLRLEVRRKERQRALVDLTLKRNGWGGVKVRKRLLDVAGLPWPDEDPGDKVVFEVQQKLF